MKERPIMFSAPMMRALLVGTKTQTRRGLKLPHGLWETSPNGELVPIPVNCPYGQPGDTLWVRETFYAFGRWILAYDAKKDRDAWTFIDMTAECGNWYFYDATGKPERVASFRRGSGVTPMWWKRPAIFMPHAASRTLLEVTEVRVQRLQDISEDDALAEGVDGERVMLYANKGSTLPMMRAYRDVWGAINGHDGPGSWAANPWVWAVSFRRITP